MNKAGPPKKEPEFDPKLVRDISEQVYRQRLDDPGNKPGKSAASMIAKDGDNGEKLRGRAICYDEMTRAYIKALLVLGYVL